MGLGELEQFMIKRKKEFSSLPIFILKSFSTTVKASHNCLWISSAKAAIPLEGATRIAP
jgi:hypothetical protein